MDYAANGPAEQGAGGGAARGADRAGDDEGATAGHCAAIVTEARVDASRARRTPGAGYLADLSVSREFPRGPCILVEPALGEPPLSPGQEKRTIPGPRCINRSSP